MIYYGIFNDGKYISKNNLKDLIKVPGVLYFLRSVDSTGNSLDKNFTLVTDADTLYLLKIGDFELIDISQEIYHRHDHRRHAQITLINHKTGNTIQHKICTDGNPSFVTNELIPLMEKLHDLGSYEMYKKSLEFDDLKSENQRLIGENRQLREQLNLITGN
jgi:hypothetical protein